MNLVPWFWEPYDSLEDAIHDRDVDVKLGLDTVVVRNPETGEYDTTLRAAAEHFGLEIVDV